MVYYAYRGASFYREIGRLWRGRRKHVNRIETRGILHDSTVEAIRRDMEHLARLSTTSQPAWCFTIGWTGLEYESSENIGADTLVNFADRFFGEARFSDSQRVYFVHGDGSDPHLHAVVNGVDAYSGTLHQWDHVRYLKALWRVEKSDPDRTYAREEMREEKGGALNIRELIWSHHTQSPYRWLVKQETRTVFEQHWQTWPRLQRNLAKRGFVLQVEPRQDWPEAVWDENNTDVKKRWRGTLTDGNERISVGKVWPEINLFEDIADGIGNYTEPEVGGFPKPAHEAFYGRLRHASLEKINQPCPELTCHRFAKKEKSSGKGENGRDLSEIAEDLERLIDEGLTDEQSSDEGRSDEEFDGGGRKTNGPAAIRVDPAFWLGRARLLKRLDYLRESKALLASCPMRPEVIVELGDLARRNGEDCEEVERKYLRPAFQKDPSSWMAALQLGLSHLRSEKIKSSIHLLRRALDIGKRNESPEQEAIARSELAKALRRAGQKEEAREVVGTKEVSEEDLQVPYEEKSYASRRLLIEKLWQNRNRVDVEEQLSEIARSLTEVDPTSPTGWLWRGRFTTGKESLENYHRAVKIAPLWKEPRVEMIKHLRAVGSLIVENRLDLFQEHVGKLLAIDPESTPGWYWRGVGLVKAERYAEALWCLERLETVRSDEMAQDWYWKGRACYGMGDFKQAAGCFRRAEMQERYRDALERGVDALRKCGRLEEAIDLIDRKLESGGTEDSQGMRDYFKGKLLKKRGQVYEELDCPEKALESYSEAAEKDSGAYAD